LVTKVTVSARRGGVSSKFEEIEDEIALNYEKAKPGSALPWDTVRPAVNLVWERMTGVISPREPDRGVRDWI
jgi:hypothetical protein